MLKKEQKRLNKKHCKNMPFDIKIQCWWFRNYEIIIIIISSIITSILSILLLMLLKEI